MKKITLYCFFGLLLSSNAWSKEEWVKKQFHYSIEQTLNNISRSDTPKGFIVASPSRFDPPYYYHWVRDAALTMRAVDKTLSWEKKLPLFKDYVTLERSHQQTYTLTGLGEPKFNTDGSGYTDDWCRPQNDGPALRAVTMILFANQMLERGEENYVLDYLYAPQLPANTVIKTDLEYTSHHWRETDCDLWEETRGKHFYTRMAQRQAMILGSKLAERLNDPEAAGWYAKIAKEIEHELENHWSNEKQYILTTLDRSTTEGLMTKETNLDASVVLAVLHSEVPGRSFDINDERILKTAHKLIEKFKEIYAINHTGEGTAIGRYPEDSYYGGNPWFLLTNGFAEYFYKLSKAKGNQNDLNELAESFISRSRAHADPSGQMDEQFDRNNGYMKSAQHLTWSYASFMTMYLQRQETLKQ